MRKVNRALRERLLRSWKNDPYATLPFSVMPQTEREFMDESIEDEDPSDDEYNLL
jgi:hypothetical protein